MKINNFWGDLTAVSTKKLYWSWCVDDAVTRDGIKQYTASEIIGIARSKYEMCLFATVPHPHGHWQLQELLGNHLGDHCVYRKDDMVTIKTTQIHVGIELSRPVYQQIISASFLAELIG